MFKKKKEVGILELVGAASVGAGIGILIGVLIAPKKGRDTMADIKDKTIDLVDNAKEIGKNVKNKIQNGAEDIFYYDENDKLVFSKDFRKKAEEKVESGKKFFTKGFKKAEDAMEDVAENVEDTLEEVTEDVEDTVEEVTENVEDNVEEVAEDVEDTVEEVVKGKDTKKKVPAWMKNLKD